MSEPWVVGLLSLGAALAIPLGGVLARVQKLRPGWLDNEIRHFIIAFGAGALLSAVALVLVPHGREHLSLPWVIVLFSAGGLAFMALDITLHRIDSPASNLVAALSDFVPEALALGAAFGSGGNTGPLIALLIALQNVPEGFNAYREMVDDGGMSGGRVLGLYLALSTLGPVCGLAGYFWLSGAQGVMGGIAMFASGGILYLVMQDIAPQARLRNHWAPPLGAVAGFLLGLAAQIMTGA